MGTEKVAGHGFGHERSSTVHTAGAFEVWEEALTWMPPGTRLRQNFQSPSAPTTSQPFATACQGWSAIQRSKTATPVLASSTLRASASVTGSPVSADEQASTGQPEHDAEHRNPHGGAEDVTRPADLLCSMQGTERRSGFDHVGHGCTLRLGTRHVHNLRMNYKLVLLPPGEAVSVMRRR